MRAIKYQGRIWIPSDRAVSAELPIPDLDKLEAKVEKVRENGNRAIENLWKTITDKDEQIKQLKENQCCLNCMYYNTDGCTLSGLGAER